jgi:hypothetical protein
VSEAEEFGWIVEMPWHAKLVTKDFWDFKVYYLHDMLRGRS